MLIRYSDGYNIFGDEDDANLRLVVKRSISAVIKSQSDNEKNKRKMKHV